MSTLREAAEAAARGATWPVLTAERLFASERVAAGLDAQRMPRVAPWDDLAERALKDLAALSDGALRRWLDGMWEAGAAPALTIASIAAALARGRRSCDRALIETYLRRYPQHQPGFAALREAAGFAAERHDWAWRERGWRWGLWEKDAIARLSVAIADGNEVAMLARAGLVGALGDGAFAAMIRARPMRQDLP